MRHAPDGISWNVAFLCVCRFDGTRFAFINSHFAAHDRKWKRRNRDYHRINSGLFAQGGRRQSGQYLRKWVMHFVLHINIMYFGLIMCYGNVTMAYHAHAMAGGSTCAIIYIQLSVLSKYLNVDMVHILLCRSWRRLRLFCRRQCDDQVAKQGQRCWQLTRRQCHQLARQGDKRSRSIAVTRPVAAARRPQPFALHWHSGSSACQLTSSAPANRSASRLDSLGTGRCVLVIPSAGSPPAPPAAAAAAHCAPHRHRPARLTGQGSPDGRHAAQRGRQPRLSFWGVCALATTGAA